MANRQEILDQFAQNFGLVPDFLSEMPDPVLEQYNNTLNWVLSDTALSARDKALVAFGAAFEQNLPDEEFLDYAPEKKDPEIGLLTVRQGFTSKKAFIAHAINSLLIWSNIVGVDKYKWKRVFHYYVKENLSLSLANG